MLPLLANMFSQTIVTSTQVNKNIYKSGEPWFDSECKLSRKEYFKAKDKFRTSRREVHRTEMVVKGRFYRRFLRKKRNNYYKALHTKLRTLKSTSPKDYWKFLNVKSKAKSSAVIKVSLDDFVKHFQNLAKVHSCDSTDGDNVNVDHFSRL